MKDYERTCFTAYPNSWRGSRPQPRLTVYKVEKHSDLTYEIWFEAGDDQWWYEFKDWLLSYVTEPTWVGHHSSHASNIMMCAKDAMLFKLLQTG